MLRTSQVTGKMMKSAAVVFVAESRNSINRRKRELCVAIDELTATLFS